MTKRSDQQPTKPRRLSEAEALLADLEPEVAREVLAEPPKAPPKRDDG